MPPIADSGPIDALYRDVILDHYRRPRGRSPLASPHGSATVSNPVCGDQSRVEVTLREGRIDQVSVRSRGCSLCVASGSIMSERVQGARPSAAAALHASLHKLVEGGEADPGLDPRLLAFSGVGRFPGRRRCATLAWEALEGALAEAGDPPR
ncbi:MAG: Fe-S cluster assembly sulfur transfer protein SufU [Myxococcota bacterium]